MGKEVEGVPRHPGVDPGSDEESSGFGPWLRHQRELRGVSLPELALRTKLRTERVCAIEQGEALSADGQGRALARTLAVAIGADPQVAVLLLGPPRGRGRPQRRLQFGFRGLRPASLLAAAALLAWLLVELMLGRNVAGDLSGVVYRPDYVKRLVGEPP